MEYIGFLTAILMLVAALFGLIPPVFSKSVKDSQVDFEAARILGIIRPLLLIGGIMFLFFAFSFGVTELERVQLAKARETAPVQERSVPHIEISDEDRIIIASARLLTIASERNNALIEIIEFALARDNYHLAIYAASEILNTQTRNQKLNFIRHKMLDANVDPVEETSTP